MIPSRLSGAAVRSRLLREAFAPLAVAYRASGIVDAMAAEAVREIEADLARAYAPPSLFISGVTGWLVMLDGRLAKHCPGAKPLLDQCEAFKALARRLDGEETRELYLAKAEAA